MAVKLYFHFKESTSCNIYTLLNLLNIARSTLYLWISIYNSNQMCFSKGFKINMCKRSNKITDVIIKYICEYVTKKCTFNVKSLRQCIRRKFNVCISKSYIYYILKSNNLTLKKVQEKTIPKKNSYIKQKNELLKKITNSEYDNIVSLDESHIVIGKKTNYAWALKGKRSITKIRPNTKKYSLIMAISKNKVVKYELINKAVNGETFKNFVCDDIISKSNNNHILMDNARIHHYAKFKKYLTDNDLFNKIIYNVPYHPQYNPIECVFNVIKQHLYRKNINNYESLNKNLSIIVRKLNRTGFEKYYNHSFENLRYDVKLK